MEFLILFSFSASFFFGKSRFGTLKFYMGNKSTAQCMPKDLVLAAFLCVYSVPLEPHEEVVTIDLFY